MVQFVFVHSGYVDDLFFVNLSYAHAMLEKSTCFETRLTDVFTDAANNDSTVEGAGRLRARPNHHNDGRMVAR